MTEAHNIEFNESIHAKCKFCAEVILKEAKKCKHCGEFQDSNIEDLKNNGKQVQTILVENLPSDGVAGLISLFIVGGGQIYKGHPFTGIILMIMVYPSLLLFPIAGLLLYIFNIIHAFVCESEQAAAQAEATRRARQKSIGNGNGTEFIE